MTPSSIRKADIEFEQVVQELPEELEPLARELKAFVYRRKIRSPKQLLRLVLLYCAVDKSLREVAGNMALLGVEMTDTAVLKRLQAAKDWLEALIRKMLKMEYIDTVERAGRRIVAIDATILKAVGSKGIDYRVHVSIDLMTLEFISIKFSNSKTGETLRNYQFQSGDIVVADAAYSSATNICDLKEQGVDVIVRWNHANPIYDRNGEELDLEEALRGQAEETIQTIPVLLKSSSKKKGMRKQIPGYLHIYRMPKDKAQQQRKKRIQGYRKKKKKVNPRTLFLCQFVIVFTTLEPEEFSAETVLELYRVRWQIELVFKRLKSILHINQLRTRLGGRLADIYLSGKLLYALLLDRLLTKRTQQRQAIRLEAERRQTPWRSLKLLHDELRVWIIGSAHWNEDFWPLCQKLMAERPRRRKLQKLPRRIQAMDKREELHESAA